MAWRQIQIEKNKDEFAEAGAVAISITGGDYQTGISGGIRVQNVDAGEKYPRRIFLPLLTSP